MNTENFIAGLNKLNFVEYKDGVLRTASGFEITYEIKLMGGISPMYPIQFLFRVRKNDTHVMTWGCSTNEENIMSVTWWLTKTYAMDDMEYTRKSDNKARLTEEFNLLTK